MKQALSHMVAAFVAIWIFYTIGVCFPVFAPLADPCAVLAAVWCVSAGIIILVTWVG